MWSWDVSTNRTLGLAMVSAKLVVRLLRGRFEFVSGASGRDGVVWLRWAVWRGKVGRGSIYLSPSAVSGP